MSVSLSRLPGMTLSTFDCIAAITEHSAGFAEATRDNLDARVEHCPDWSVADLVWHLTEVHWFWSTIAAEQLSAPPDEGRRPPRPDDAGLVDTFKAGAVKLVEVLREADQSAPCWTWARLAAGHRLHHPPPGPGGRRPPLGRRQRRRWVADHRARRGCGQHRRVPALLGRLRRRPRRAHHSPAGRHPRLPGHRHRRRLDPHRRRRPAPRASPRGCRRARRSSRRPRPT